MIHTPSNLSGQIKIPAMLHFLTNFPNIDEYVRQSQIDEKCTYSFERQITVDENNTPLYCSRSATPPTSCLTPGKTIPAGYTPSGNYKTSTYRPSKMDKRGGK